MAYYFLGILCALLLTMVLILDLERKRHKLRHILSRLGGSAVGREGVPPVG